MKEKIEKCCRTCAWHDYFSGVCVNGGSPYCADFTDMDKRCKEWEMSEDIKHERLSSK